MPITRRKRANPPEQPENNNHSTEQPENTVEAIPSEQTPANSAAPVAQSTLPVPVETEQPAAPTPSSTPEQGENTSHISPVSPMVHATDIENDEKNENNANLTYQPVGTSPQPPVAPPALNGERTERSERIERQGHEYTPPIEGGRRTARGELFRRPPQAPQAAQPLQPPVVQSPAPALQAPSHEITLPLGKRPGDTHGDPLHLAYNPGYTGSDEVRSHLLHQLAQESKAGGRARCWNCGSIAIVYDRWNTRSKTFGEIGVAMCEICGVWSVM